jgi:hypothetical protein
VSASRAPGCSRRSRDGEAADQQPVGGGGELGHQGQGRGAEASEGARSLCGSPSRVPAVGVICAQECFRLVERVQPQAGAGDELYSGLRLDARVTGFWRCLRALFVEWSSTFGERLSLWRGLMTQHVERASCAEESTAYAWRFCAVGKACRKHSSRPNSSRLHNAGRRWRSSWATRRPSWSTSCSSGSWRALPPGAGATG